VESPSFNFRGQFALVFRFSADVYWTRDPANRGRSDLDSGLHEAGSLFGLDELFKAEGLDIQSPQALWNLDGTFCRPQRKVVASQTSSSMKP
jgi:hypothetical protein